MIARIRGGIPKLPRVDPADLRFVSGTLGLVLLALTVLVTAAAGLGLAVRVFRAISGLGG